MNNIFSTSKICTVCKIDKPINQFYKIDSKPCSQCKSCKKKYNQKRSRTINGLIYKIYHAQLSKSKERGHLPPDYSFEWLKDFIKSQPAFGLMYIKWIRSNYNMKLTPSIDRKNPLLGYTKSNIQLMTWGENESKSRIETQTILKSGKNKRPVTLKSTSTGQEYNFNSIEEAKRTLNISNAQVQRVINKNRTSKGYYWKDLYVT